MTKNFRTFIAFSALTLSMTALPAVGAEVSSVRFTVPFPFTAGGTNLPAGDYFVSQQAGNHILTIAGTGGDAILMAQPASPSPDLNVSTLTFERTSKGNMLTVVRLGANASSLTKYKPSSAR